MQSWSPDPTCTASTKSLLIDPLELGSFFDAEASLQNRQSVTDFRCVGVSAPSRSVMFPQSLWSPQHPPWSPEHLIVCVCVSVARIWVWCVVFEQTLDRCLGLFADSYKTPEYSAWLGIPLLAILGDLSAQASSPIFERIFNHFIHCRLNFAFHIPFPHPIVYVMLRPKECDNYKPCPHWSTRNKTKFLNHLGFLLLLRASSRIWGHIWIGF